MTISVNTNNSLQLNNSYNNYVKQNVNNRRLKVASAVGSTAGIATALCAVTKKNPMRLVQKMGSPKKIFNNLKKIELSGKDTITIATGSIAGGFLAGSACDGDNVKAKFKEGLTQLVGNYIIPSAFVVGGIKLNKKLNQKFKFPPKTAFMKFCFGMLSLIAGVYTGNKVSKAINSKIFKENQERDLNYKDWGMQVDNVCLVTSVANQGTSIAQNVSKVIPVAHLLPGYLTGIKK